VKTLLLLPGMDGTGELFERFVATAPPGYRALSMRLPPLAKFDELETALFPQLPADAFSIVAESFSGPLGIRLAARASDRVEALIFSNTFADGARSSLYALVPWALAFRFPPPRWVIRRYLLGRFINRQNLAAIRVAAAQTSPGIMARRLIATLRVDDTPLLRKLRLPMLYLRGTEDRLVLDESVEAMQQANPAIVRRDIAAPHLLLQTAAEEAWSNIDAFITIPGRRKGGIE
jgi:pimeloyl-ACP methyl ester carboxylesterase